MWTPTTRAQHMRAGLRYGSDLTDAEWAMLEPLLPPPATCGRHWAWPLREVVNAISYVLRTGCPWRLLPDGFPPYTTVYRWFARRREARWWEAVNHLFVMADRERCGREASPTAAVLDSQSVKTTEAGGPSGYDAGKKVRGRKRQLLVDTDGRTLALQVQPACVQDRDGAGPVLRASRARWPFIERASVDGGYAGQRVAGASGIAIDVVRKPPDQVGFAVHPRRWVVERSFAWFGRNRRLAKDYETLTPTSEAFLYAASVIFLLRRIARC
jgi:putative transposase